MRRSYEIIIANQRFELKSAARGCYGAAQNVFRNETHGGSGRIDDNRRFGTVALALTEVVERGRVQILQRNGKFVAVDGIDGTVECHVVDENFRSGRNGGRIGVRQGGAEGTNGKAGIFVNTGIVNATAVSAARRVFCDDIATGCGQVDCLRDTASADGFAVKHLLHIGVYGVSGGIAERRGGDAVTAQTLRRRTLYRLTAGYGGRCLERGCIEIVVTITTHEIFFLS